MVAIRKNALTIAGGIYREASNKLEFEKVLNEFAERQLDLLVLIAGDGTIHAVLSHMLSRRIFSPLPPIVIIPAGTTNMTAKEFNAFGKPGKAMRRHTKKLAQSRPPSFITRPVLRIQNGESSPEYGMFFGTGVITNGVKYFRKRVRGTGLTGEKASAIVLLRYLFSLLSGYGEDVHEHVKTGVQINEDNRTDEDCILIFATSLNRLLLGLRPYWGVQDRPVHTTLIRKSPNRLWRSILPLIRGRGGLLSEADGYRSVNLSTLTLTMTADYIIDGEIYSADENVGAVHISADDSISVMDLSN